MLRTDLFVPDNSGTPNLSELDASMANYWRRNETGDLGTWLSYPVPGQPGVLHAPDVWAICVKVGRTGQDPVWHIYVYTSWEDPGWAFNPHDAVPFPTAEKFAQGLKDQGHEVFLRKYIDFEVTYTPSTLPLT